MDVIYFGTFAPMHIGHMHNVNKCLDQYEKTHLIVSGYQGDRGDQIGLNLDIRYQTIKKIFENNDRVSVYKLCEDQIPMMPNGWVQWLDEIDKLVNDSQKKVFVCGEKEYKSKLNEFGYEVDLFSRQEVIISATKIRSNPQKYENYIVNQFKQYLIKE